MSEDRGQRSEVGGRRTEGGGQRAEVRGRRSEDGDLREEVQTSDFRFPSPSARQAISDFRLQTSESFFDYKWAWIV
jgi:hypothetical protein